MNEDFVYILKRTVFYIFMFFISIVMIYPFLWAATASLKTTQQLYNGNPLDLLPEPAILKNYQRALTVLPFLRFLLNSAFLSIVVPVLMLILASMAAYAFAKLRFKGRDAIFLILLATMMIPGAITLIPNYIIISKLGWINNYLALIIPPLFKDANVFNIFFLRQYFMSIPKDLEEAAIIDGCSRFRTFLRIIMPNAKPALATVGILSFNGQWNSFLWPLIVMNDYKKMPIQVGLSYFRGMTSNWGELLAGTTLALVPIIVVFLIFQKYFIKSVVTTGFGGQ